MATALEDFNADQFTSLNWIMWATALLTTILRLVVRYRKLKQLFWDDIFAISAIVWLTVMAILNHLSLDAIYFMAAIAKGETPSAQFTTAEKIATTRVSQSKMQFCFMISFWNCLWSAKGSLLMFYRKLFTGVDGYMKWWWIVVGSCIVTWMISLLTNFMVCMPLTRRFSMDQKDACPSAPGINAIWVATSIDIATDIMVAVLPIRLLIGLRISLKQKLGIGAIFSLGVVIVFFSIIRLVKVIESIENRSATGNVSLALWSMLETSVAVVVGSLPTLKSLITSKGDTGYTSRAKQTVRGTNTGTSSSNAAKGPHIRLYGMETLGVRSTVLTGGYGSDEALHKENKSGNNRITKTQEISISSEEAGRGNSMENVHHARQEFVAIFNK